MMQGFLKTQHLVQLSTAVDTAKILLASGQMLIRVQNCTTQTGEGHILSTWNKNDIFSCLFLL